MWVWVSLCLPVIVCALVERCIGCFTSCCLAVFFSFFFLIVARFVFAGTGPPSSHTEDAPASHTLCLFLYIYASSNGVQFVFDASLLLLAPLLLISPLVVVAPAFSLFECFFSSLVGESPPLGVHEEVKLCAITDVSTTISYISKHTHVSARVARLSCSLFL